MSPDDWRSWAGIYPAHRGDVGDFRPGPGYNVPVTFPLIIALVLGLRHAFDPDHLAAVSGLLLTKDQSTAGRAALLGLAWGLGHATTLAIFGLPLVLLSRSLPDVIQRGAELIIGIIIVALALRLLRRWRAGHFHVHDHQHGLVRHVHAHVHGRAHASGEAGEHAHEHGEGLGRSPAASFGIGLMHGVGGSAGAGMLLMGTVSGPKEGVIALVVFAAATAVSMSVLTLALAYLVTRRALRRRFETLVPFFGTAGLLFGVWYSLAALQ
jgi:ABC-type nickel/cobalt efflux system permease component RcnA